MNDGYSLGPCGTCVGITVCPLIAVGPPSPILDNLQDIPECIRKMFPQSTTPSEIIKAVWDHIKQCPLIRTYLDQSQKVQFKSSLGKHVINASSELVKVWNEVGLTKTRSDRWEATLSVEAAQWNVLASKFVDLTRQTLLGAVKSLPVEFRQRDLVEFQGNLQARRRDALELRDNMVRRIQRINKQHQINEESRRMLLHYVTNEVNAKLEEATETQNLIERHHYIARVTNKAKQERMAKPIQLAHRELEQKAERLKLLALDPNRQELGLRYLQEDELPNINVNFVNKFDTKAVAAKMGDLILERDRERKQPKTEVPAEGSIALDFFTGGFWLRKDQYRLPQHEREMDYTERKWRLSVGERRTTDFVGSDIKSQWLKKPKKKPRQSSNPKRRVDPQIEYSRIHQNIGHVRDELKNYLNRPELGQMYSAYDPTDYLPVADVVRKEADRIEAAKLQRATERAKAEKKKQRAEEKKRVPRSKESKSLAPAFPLPWIVPAGPSAPPREYKRVVDDLNTIDTCGALTADNFVDYRPQHADRYADSYI